MEDNFITILIMGIISILCIWMLIAIHTETIDTDTLDNICKHLKNDTDAQYYDNGWYHYDIACVTNNIITLYGEG